MDVAGSSPCQISRGMPPKTMCHPVTATGSLRRQAKRLITVPRAMVRAANSIHPVPDCHPDSHEDRSASSHQWFSRGAGTPRQTIPAKPRAKPSQPNGLIDSANSHRARSATINGWESINTEPSPAPVPSIPLARKIWNKKASTRVNSTNQPRSPGSIRRERPSQGTATSRTAPAGRSLRQATSAGPPE